MTTGVVISLGMVKLGGKIMVDGNGEIIGAIEELLNDSGTLVQLMITIEGDPGMVM
jgi:hypothetical protein